MIDRQDREACSQRLQEHYRSWRHCEFDCHGDCQYGWGACAFAVYGQVGLAVGGQCDGAGGRDAAAALDAGQD